MGGDGGLGRQESNPGERDGRRMDWDGLPRKDGGERDGRRVGRDGVGEGGKMEGS